MAKPPMLSYGPVSGHSRPFFEDLTVGQEFTSPGRTVTEADIVIFGERIAHGLLGLSIEQGLASRGEPTAAQGVLSGIKWKFKGPIKIGDTVHVRSRIAAKKDGPDAGRGLVTVERELVNQLGEVVQEGETEHAVERRPK
jgi:acyl dehydratase